MLVFYPGDNTPVCTLQLRSYSEDMAGSTEVGAQVLGHQPPGRGQPRDVRPSYGLRLPLLADTDKAVGERYGILGPLGFYRRSVFVVDADGIIRYARRSLTSLTFVPSAASWSSAVRASD